MDMEFIGKWEKRQGKGLVWMLILSFFFFFFLLRLSTFFCFFAFVETDLKGSNGDLYRNKSWTFRGVCASLMFSKTRAGMISLL